MKKILLMLVCGLFILSGCSDTLTTDDLSGNTYILKNMFEGSGIYISFDGNNFSGNSIVNTFFGTYKIEDGKKFIVNDEGMSTGMTMMAGAPEDMENEQKFIEIFNDVSTISLSGETLTLTANSGEKLIFDLGSVEESTPALDMSSLSGKEFRLTNMFEESDITVAFDDNNISGKSAVNNYMGTYLIDGNIFIIEGSLGTTRMMGEQAQMEVETKYLQMLQSVVSATLNGNILTLITSDGTSLIFKQI